MKNTFKKIGLVSLIAAKSYLGGCGIAKMASYGLHESCAQVKNVRVCIDKPYGKSEKPGVMTIERFNDKGEVEYIITDVDCDGLAEKWQYYHKDKLIMQAGSLFKYRKPLKVLEQVKKKRNQSNVRIRSNNDLIDRIQFYEYGAPVYYIEDDMLKENITK